MIHVSKQQLSQVEYLIAQSKQGNHVLFGTELIRRIFSTRDLHCRQPKLSVEEAYAVEHHIERMILLPSLAEKRAYLENLESDTLERVVHAYFNIVENNLFETLEGRH